MLKKIYIYKIKKKAAPKFPYFHLYKLVRMKANDTAECKY